MPLSVEIHLPAELAVAARILAGHVVSGVGGARLHRLLVTGLHQLHQALTPPRIRCRPEQRLPPRRRQRVTERREDEAGRRASRRRRRRQRPDPGGATAARGCASMRGGLGAPSNRLSQIQDLIIYASI
ncbi:S-adenosyl-L-methionine-dependent methyltransferases superfamily protein [Actinidia rufa]|uniref:S-adenosyl-L-methionine-dependent methyltransferases superfamily protein n=1 Tax=Actinidia rufa TaxID=165716 RepID=A0A7J0F2E1_9ERIC|nr:S-adenosyl-L-methionine-dependent methyltransferases superfamily protein [Actinidia rufa]